MRKILIAMDGSEQAMNAVRYVSGFFPPEQTRAVLFHVGAEVPESFLDLQREPGFRSSVISINSWSAQIKKNIEEFMQKAKNILIAAGFPAESVTVKVQTKKIGVARDIVRESHEGYDAVVLGRSGVSRLKDIIVGSVANKLIGKMPHVPVVAVGGNPDSKHIIIGFDGSDGAMKAVNCTASMMYRPDREVMLCHVIRPLNIHLGMDMFFTATEEDGWVKANIEEIEPAFEKAKQCLSESGFASDHIRTEVAKDEASRSGGVIKKARAYGYDTVVVGRRGLTVIEEFIMGRVSRKVLQMADRMAVWIV
ncbi:MAG: hypothetical protein BWK80_32390 [Desulfobacteraceae bacterium IS3]|nr:MAG: hypothetical protein BWK80_32390 [Desulfobacteraceae bacterium IS3]